MVCRLSIRHSTLKILSKEPFKFHIRKHANIFWAILPVALPGEVGECKDPSSPCTPRWTEREVGIPVPGECRRCWFHALPRVQLPQSGKVRREGRSMVTMGRRLQCFKGWCNLCTHSPRSNSVSQRHPLSRAVSVSACSSLACFP